MSELPSVQHRIQVLQHYMRAMECGDVETIATILEDAGHDQGLERMLLEVNAVYQHEDRTIVRAADAAAAQQMLLTLAEETIFPVYSSWSRKNGSSNRFQQGEYIFLSQNRLSENTPGRKEMFHSSSNVRKVSEQAALYNTHGGQDNNTNGNPEQKIQGRKIATPVFPARIVNAPQWYSSRKSWIAASVAAILIVILLVPGTSALASQLLSLFRVQNFQTVQVTHQDITALSQYSAPRVDDLGSIQFQANSFHMRNNLTQEQAVKSVQFPVVLPAKLPDGVSNSPAFSVVEAGHGVFTFSAAKLHVYLVKNGYGNVKIPANLDGATFDVTTTAGVMIKYGYHGGNPFIVVEMPSPVIRATGSASLEQLQSFMLSLPGLPPSLVAQLKQIDISKGTMPIPVPAGVDAHTVTVNGASGVLLNTTKTTTIENVKQFPVGSVLVWQSKNIIYALGGITTTATQLLAAANSIA